MRVRRRAPPPTRSASCTSPAPRTRARCVFFFPARLRQRLSAARRRAWARRSEAVAGSVVRTGSEEDPAGGDDGSGAGASPVGCAPLAAGAERGHAVERAGHVQVARADLPALVGLARSTGDLVTALDDHHRHGPARPVPQPVDAGHRRSRVDQRGADLGGREPAAERRHAPSTAAPPPRPRRGATTSTCRSAACSTARTARRPGAAGRRAPRPTGRPRRRSCSRRPASGRSGCWCRAR